MHYALMPFMLLCDLWSASSILFLSVPTTDKSEEQVIMKDPEIKSQPC